MRPFLLILVLPLLLILTCPGLAQAQDPVTEVIKAGVKKAIKAVDLQIQRQQNKVLWLQNAQRQLENSMSRLRLGEIHDWVGRQHSLYSQYYQELYQVRGLVADFQRLQGITRAQARLLAEYERVWRLLRQDPHFSAEELAYMARVYGGMLEECAHHLDLVLLAVQALTTQMGDAGRLELLTLAASRMETVYNDLLRFNAQNIHLSLQRARSRQEAETLRRLYGLPAPQ